MAEKAILTNKKEEEETAYLNWHRMGKKETVLKYLHLFAQHRMGQMETANREFLL